MEKNAAGAHSAEPSRYVHEADGVLEIAVSTQSAGTSLAEDGLSAGVVALREVARGEREVGAVLLRGAGANFCAGGNVRAFASANHRPQYVRELAEKLHQFVEALGEAERPVVAAVKGWAAGAGMSIALHADLAVGGPSTRMRPAYRGIGLSPDGGLTWTLPRVVGIARARSIILCDEVIDAKEAHALGLLSRVVADEDVERESRSIAKLLADGPRTALMATRALLSASNSSSLHEQLEAEARSISQLSGQYEGIEGVNAFVEKRQPDFVRPGGK